MGSVDYCTAYGTVTAIGNEPIGLGGIAGCIQSTPSITGNTVNVIINARNGHAIGGLCGYVGKEDDGDGIIEEPCAITDCKVTAIINTDGATHVGGLVGTGLYFYGMEDRFSVENCSVVGAINGAITPGTVVGRATNSTIISCSTDVKIDKSKSNQTIGTTDFLYRGGDQYEEGCEGAAIRLVSALNGTYEELFPVILSDKYNDYWLEIATSCVGTANASAAVDMLKTTISGTLIGEEAVEAYSKDPSSARFNFDYLGNVKTIKFDNYTISGFDIEGKEVFSYLYSYVGYDEALGFYILKQRRAMQVSLPTLYSA